MTPADSIGDTSSASEAPESPALAGRPALAALAVLWTVLLGGMVLWDNRRAHTTAVALARTEALSSFNKDLVYRRWAAGHGGVYVPVTKETPPNPYLEGVKERDITTPSGRKLTLVNPAYMTRQVHELGRTTYGAQGHITSLRPLRPQNKPDAWEAAALRAFETGTREVTAVALIDSVPYLRLMRPLITEQACLKCHEKQGYKLNDIRGGLSVSVPFAPYHEAALVRRTFVLGTAGALWVLGLGLLWMTHWRILRAARRQQLADASKARLEAQLAQSQKIEMVGRLAGGVAHDFNNMLTVIRGYTEVALQQVDPAEPLAADLQEIITATDRSSDLTQQLLAFARKQTASPRILDLNEAVGGMLKMLQRLLGEDMQLVWTPAAAPQPINIDPSQLDQILVNLCLNSRDAIVDVGTLTIATASRTVDAETAATLPGCTPGVYVELRVRDTGSGMDADTLAHLFEPFYTTKPMGRGTGLGLATVFGIVKQNGGWINVESAPRQGTTFTILLPYCDRAPAPPVPARRDASSMRGRETILVVEDEAAIRSMITRLLQNQGFTVLAAGTPSEAQRLAETHAAPIEVVLTDVIMPEMNGRELVTLLQQRSPGMKAVFMSGYTADVIAHHGVLEADVDFIEKPFSGLTLAAKLREVLDRA